MRRRGIKLQYFHGGSHPRRPGSLSREQFLPLLHRVSVAPAREWLDRAMRRALRPDDACLTFDGNLRCQRDIALPILRELKLTAFWFVCTGPLQGQLAPDPIDHLFRETHFNSPREFYDAFVGQIELSGHWPMVQMLLEERAGRLDARQELEFIRDEVLSPQRYRQVMDALMTAAGFDVPSAAENLWMGDADIRALHAEGHVIGLLSHTCPARIDKLDEDAQRDEYFENYAYLHNLLHERPITMSHPNGRYDETTLAILHELEIRIGFKSDGAHGASELEIARESPFLSASRLAA